MTALSAADREEVQAELEALREKLRESAYTISHLPGAEGRRLEAIRRARGEIARLEKLLAR